MLNIDELLGEKKSIQFGGVVYDVNEPTLQNMLEAQKILESPDEAGQYEGMQKFIELLIPGLDVSTVPVRMLGAIFEYVVGTEKKTEKPAPTPLNHKKMKK